MSWLTRIENACATAIERTFAKAFPSDLEPAQVARKLVATMEAKTRSSDEGARAPGAFVVAMNGDDYERLAPHRAYLEREWGALLADMAARVSVRFSSGGPTVRMEPRDGVPAGAVEIEALLGDVEDEGVDRSAAPAHFRLRMFRGVPADGAYALGTATRVGRSDESEIFLIDPSVSRKHAVFECASGMPHVTDLHSRNGTFVNGERVTRATLRPGDIVRFGNTELRLEAGDP